MDVARPVDRIEFAPTVNAEPAAQLRLLDLQAADTALAQLAHRRATRPEVSAITATDQHMAQIDTQTLDIRTRRDDVDTDQRRLDAEIDTVRGRATRDNQRLTAGGLPAKDLENLQHEIATLARRQAALEDDVLELMEQREALDTELAGLDAQRAAAATERAELVAARDAAFADIDAAIRQRMQERSAVAAELPTELLALYDKVRAANGGVGAAAVRQRRCEGCRIELAGNELAAVRAAAPDAVVRCENCRRILVRTADSGI